jgi:hypothetical protein
MSKIESTSFDLDTFASMIGMVVDHPKWCLVREHDNMTVKSVDIKWLSWNDDLTFKQDHKYEPAVGRSLIMSPFSQYYVWQTTPITELISFTPDKVVFKTKNSNYTLTKIDETTV